MSDRRKRRRTLMNGQLTGDRTSYVSGSGTQPWNWKEDGPDANATTYPDGKLYARTEEWLFPVTRITPSTPP